MLDGDKKKMVFDINKLMGWKIGGIMYLDEIYEVVKFVFYIVLIVLVIVIIIGIIVMILIIWLIIMLLKQFVGFFKWISEGDLIEIIDICLKDELGEFGKSFNNMVLLFCFFIYIIQDLVDNVVVFFEELIVLVV